jgi:hypothetical protein
MVIIIYLILKRLLNVNNYLFWFNGTGLSIYRIIIYIKKKNN